MLTLNLSLSLKCDLAFFWGGGGKPTYQTQYYSKQSFYVLKHVW